MNFPFINSELQAVNGKYWLLILSFVAVTYGASILHDDTNSGYTLRIYPTHSTHTQYPHTVPTLSTHTQYPHSVPTLSTHTQYPHTVPTHSTHTQYPHSVPTLSTHTQYVTSTKGEVASRAQIILYINLVKRIKVFKKFTPLAFTQSVYST